MTDYKQTLNLPKTDFSMKANLPKREPEQLAYWQEIDLYQQLRQQGESRPMYELHDGPPYANARPHMGTALNKTIKDIINKSHTLSGFNTPFVPGWDCHGLPIELNVEKKVGKAGTKLNHAEFRQACRDYAVKQVDMQREDFKRMGVIANWDNPYLTMSPDYEANTVRALAKIIERGHLLRGQKPVHWCPDCGSALAEAEVEYKDKVSPAIDVAFSVLDGDKLKKAFALDDVSGDVVVPIWTTTPWTLPANQAVAMNADLDYVLLQCQADQESYAIIVADALKDDVLARYGVTDSTVLATTAGQKLEGIALQHPFLDRQVPIILGEHVTTDAGTGNVHTAPAHGQEDFQVGLVYDLPQDNPVNSRSCFVEGTPLVEGVHVYKANEIILEALRERGVLLHHADLNHSYPHCWRHKKPLIFRATPQWFISMSQNGLLDQAVKAAEGTQWVPERGERRFLSMLAGRPDWCISRQRNWGTPITLIVHKDSGEMHPNMVALMEQIASRMDTDGMEAWYSLELSDLLGNEADDYEKVTDILDVWFDAGVSHYCVLEQRDELTVPANVYFEGSDQHRGWFQSSLLTSVAIRGAAPFKTVLTHGYVADKDGDKMSKSRGNVVSPIDIVNKYGADVMRLWVSSCDYTNDMAFSDEILKRSADSYRRIRNTVRFLLSNLFDFDAEKDSVAMSDMVELDRWALDATQQLQQEIVENYTAFQLSRNYQALHKFCSITLGSFYLDIIKDRMYTAKADSHARRSAQTAMWHIVQAMVRWMAPILSFTAEEIWQLLPGKREASVLLSTWYEEIPSDLDVDRDAWTWLQQVRDEVNKVLEAKRQAGDIGSALDTQVILHANAEAYPRLARLQDELRFLLITSDAKVVEADSVGSELGIDIEVVVTEATKCVRCWQRRDDVGENALHVELCSRCIDNIEGDGEIRQFA